MAAADIYPVKEGFYDSQCDHPWSYFDLLRVYYPASGQEYEKSRSGMLRMQRVQWMQQLRRQLSGEGLSGKSGEKMIWEILPVP